MLVISYDIKDDKLRNKFAKMITKHGAIRLQYSVYEVNNSTRILDNLILMIEDMFSKHFSAEDSVIIFDVSGIRLRKYGNAIHRDKPVVYL